MSPDSASMRIAFQGEPGAYSQTAVASLFPNQIAIPLHSFQLVFESVESGSADYGVVPIENSYAGSINDTYDLLVRHRVNIVGETIVRIHHCLMAIAGTSVSDVRKVFSHPQALDQCAEFLQSLGVETVAVHDTAGAARMISEEGRQSVAAIASRQAAEIYGLEVIATDLEGSVDNSTKFVAIGKAVPPGVPSPNKTSIVFATADVPGALYKCLKEFAQRGINLSKIESRPSRARAWQYLFYLDFDAAAVEDRAKTALDGLAHHTTFLRILGSYAAAVE